MLKEIQSMTSVSLNTRMPPVFCYSIITLALYLPFPTVWAADYFDPTFLGGAGNLNGVDLSAFSHSGGGKEGQYQVTVYMNQRAVGDATLTFKLNADGKLVPEFTPEQLELWGVNVPQIPDLNRLSRSVPIDDLAHYIAEATVRPDLENLRLDLSVPQVAMQPHYSDWVDASQWEDGVPALLTNYTVSGGQAESTYGNMSTTTENLFSSLSLRGNAGPWRLRSTLTYAYSDYQGQGRQNHQRHRETNFSNTYLSRDIRRWSSTLEMGETTTGSEILDSVPFKGFKLSDNEQMLPNQLRGFAPSITGVANSNARVTVRQNGSIVYETYVAPGPFDIKDIQQSGLSGDYDVTVTEADGAERKFVVPYSSLPMMLRTGAWKYEVSGGRYSGNTTDNSRQSDFALLTGVYGLPHNMTTYGGTLLAKDYYAVSAGLGISLGEAGALSTDMTHSSSEFQYGGRQTGQSYRVRYSKSLTSTGTSVDLTALRYSTAHYYNFSEFNNEGYRLKEGANPWSNQRRRSSFQTQLSQSLAEWGALNGRLSRDDYWGSSRTVTGLSLGYSNTWDGIGFSTYYNIDRIKGSGGDWPENRQVSFNVSVPFSVFGHNPTLQSIYATTAVTHDNHGRTQNQVGLSGNVPDSGFNYSLSQGWGNQGQESNSNANVGYRGTKGNVNAGYSYSSHNRTLNLSANGGAVLHRGGVTFANTLGDSIAIVHAPEAPDVSVMNGGTKTDWRGYAIAPYLTPYSKNSIGLDPSTLPDNVELVQSNINVYPTQGAVVEATFATRVGYQVLMTLEFQGNVVPFGAAVSLVSTPEGKETDSIVGDGGQVYLSGLPESGTLAVSWGKAKTQQCEVPFNLSQLATSSDMGLHQVTLRCVNEPQ